MSDETEDTIAEIETLPLDAWHRRKGARMVPFAGYEMPIQYEGIVAEHDWTRGHAGLFDVSHMGQLTLEGPDGDIAAAAEALEALVPGLVSSLKPGRMRYTLLLAEDGGILDDLMVTNTGQHIALVVNGACKWDDIAFLREHLPDDITLTHHEDQALLALQGPEAVDALGELVPAAAELVFMTAGFYDWNGVPLWVSRAGYTGEDGVEIMLPGNDAVTLWGQLLDAGVAPIGLGARDTLRLEAGMNLYGNDMDESITPWEANMGWTLVLNDRDFVGRQPLLNQQQNGHGELVGLVLEGKGVLRAHQQVLLPNGEQGEITSGTFSPTLGKSIALARLPAGATGKVDVEIRNKRQPAQVVKPPFVRNGQAVYKAL